MSDADRLRWDERYARRGAPGAEALGPPAVFASRADEFPTTGAALDVACGPGRTAVWLARRGLLVHGLDISPVAVGQARDLALRSGVASGCRFEVVDLDRGLPPSQRFDVIVCHLFRDPRLDTALTDRLAPGGLLAIAALAHGRFGASEQELIAAFADLDVVGAGETDGVAWLLARRPGP